MPPHPTDPEYRPLLAAVPRIVAAGVELDIGRSVAAIEGDPLDAARLAGMFDGRRTVAEISDAVAEISDGDLQALVASLAEAGAVVDCAEAWRAFHSQSGITSWLARPVGEAAVAEVLAARYEQPGAGGVAVPLAPGPSSLDGAISRRRSAWPTDAPHGLDFEELSTLLSSMYRGDGPSGRPVPSGGGIYPLVLHALLRRPVGPLEPGVWWYDPAEGSVRQVRAGVPALEGLFVPAENTLDHLGAGQPVLVIAADVARGADKYASRAYRLAHIEVGAAMQNAYLVAADRGIPIRAMFGMADQEVGALLCLPDGVVPLLSLFVGL